MEEKGIDFFFCSFVEMSGAPKAKLDPATNFDEMAREGAGFAGFAAGDLGQGPHDPDVMSIPDFKSLMVLPWRRNVDWLPGNLHANGWWRARGAPMPRAPASAGNWRAGARTVTH